MTYKMYYYSVLNAIFCIVFCQLFTIIQVVRSFQTHNIGKTSNLRLAVSSYNNSNKKLDIGRTTKEKQYRDEFGVFFHDNPKQRPQTPEELVERIFHAIAASLYNKQYFDPATAANARAKSLYTERPVRSPASKVGRIGIELDGVEHLFNNNNSSSNNNSPSTSTTTRISGRSAIRQISILLATKLSSKQCWKEFEDHTSTSTTSTQSDNTSNDDENNRPVVLVFNTIKEALAARREMRLLQERMMCHPGIFDHIIIQTISDCKIPQFGSNNPRPKEETGRQQRRRRKKRGWIENLTTNPTSGIVIVCQPTDFSHVFEPPSPSVNTVTDFQKLIFRALLQETPVIVLSPRFLSQTDVAGLGRNGYQRADYYGGTEPPNSPELFVMRDFSPPTFSYIALQQQNSSPGGSRHRHSSNIVLMNTVMDEVRL